MFPWTGSWASHVGLLKPFFLSFHSKPCLDPGQLWNFHLFSKAFEKWDKGLNWSRNSYIWPSFRFYKQKTENSILEMHIKRLQTLWNGFLIGMVYWVVTNNWHSHSSQMFWKCRFQGIGLTLSGDFVKYQCHPGYTLLGSDTLTCKLSSQLLFQGSPPTCEGMWDSGDLVALIVCRHGFEFDSGLWWVSPTMQTSCQQRHQKTLLPLAHTQKETKITW